MYLVVPLFTLAQYPIVTKIGKDSVVVISLKQGVEINKKFDEVNKEIVSLKGSIQSVKEAEKVALQQRDSLNFLLRKSMDSSLRYKFMYEEKSKTHDRQMRIWDVDRRHYIGFSTVLVLLTIVMSGL